MLRVLCACQFTVFCGFIGYMASLSLFLMSAFDLSAQETTPILAFSGICSFIGMSGIGLVRRCGMDEIAIASVGLGTSASKPVDYLLTIEMGNKLRAFAQNKLLHLLVGQICLFRIM